MPWHNNKFYFERDKLNVSNLRFNEMPANTPDASNVLVFNTETNEVVSRTVSSLPGSGSGSPGDNGFDANSSIWKYGGYSTDLGSAAEGYFYSAEGLTDGGTTYNGNPVPGNNAMFFQLVGASPATSATPDSTSLILLFHINSHETPLGNPNMLTWIESISINDRLVVRSVTNPKDLVIGSYIRCSYSYK